MLNNSIYSIFDRFLIAGLKFATIVVLGHFLGETGQGIYSLYIVVWAWVGTFEDLGLGVANIYFGAKAVLPKNVSALLGNSLIFSLVSGMLATAIVWFLAVFTEIFKAFPSGHLPILLSGVLLYALFRPLRGLLLGLEEFKIKAISSLAIYGFFLGLLVWKNYSGVLSEYTVGSDWLIATGIGIFIWIFQCLKRARYRVSWDIELLKKQITYGGKSYKYYLTNGALNRVDMLIVSFLLGAEGIGIYSVAIYFATVLIYFPSAISPVILTSLGSEKQLPNLFFRYISTVFLAVIVGSALLIPGLIIIFFPPQYKLAILPAEIIIFGVYWLGMGGIGAFHLFGSENLDAPFRISLIAVLVEIVLAFLFIPAKGVIGAAIASMIAYTLFGILILRALIKTTDYSISTLLLPVSPIKLFRRLISSYGKHG
jgi:O-antigen/teichoic acid export membrane protein